MALISVTISGNAAPLKKSVDESEGLLGKLGGAFTKIGVVAAAGFAAAGAGIVSAIGKASDLNETMSKVGVIFGDADAAVKEFAKNAASSLGQSQQQALDAAATFGIFGKSAGLAGDDLSTFSTDFVSLASDLSSFNNTSPETAINAIGAALRGESEPLRAFGVLLNDATLKEAALALGIYDGNGALTAQQKILAAQKVIFEQTTDAQGDFARTSEGLANQQKILKARLTDTLTEIGTAFLPIAVQAIGVLNDGLGPAVSFLTEKAIPKLKEVFGIVSAFIEDKVVPVLRDKLIPFITNVATFIGEKLVPVIRDVAIIVFGKLADVFDTVSRKIEDNRGKIDKLVTFFSKLVGFITKDVAPVLIKTLGVAFDIVAKAIGPVIDVVFTLIGALASLGTFLLKIAGFVVAVFEGMVNGIIAGVNFAIRALNLLPGVEIDEIKGVSFSGGALPTAPTAPTRSETPGVSGVTDTFDRTGASRTIPSTMPTITPPTVGSPSGGGGSRGSGGGNRVAMQPIRTFSTNYGISDEMLFGAAALTGTPQRTLPDVVNITVNTVTMNEAFPTLVVEALQKYNLVNGPADFTIAV